MVTPVALIRYCCHSRHNLTQYSVSCFVFFGIPSLLAFLISSSDFGAANILLELAGVELAA